MDTIFSRVNSSHEAASRFVVTVGRVMVLLSLVGFASEVQATKCGPGMLTYAVYDANGNQAAGIRCVRLVWAKPGDNYTSTFNWYGEGAWGAATYRHLGYAYNAWELPFALAADVFGNGESYNGGTFSNLQFSIVGAWPSPSEIRVTGGWLETWRLVESVDYVPLPRPVTCGPNFATYVAGDSTGIKGGGIRCSGAGGWLGFGDWDGVSYLDVFTSSYAGDSDQVVGLCDPAFGNACNAAGAVYLNRRQGPPWFDAFQISGARSEVWTRANTAMYDSTYRAPFCGANGAACVSGGALRGRSAQGPEANAPNTVDACPDGPAGSYHSDESIDSLAVTTLDGSSLQFGRTVRIDVRVWAHSGYQADRLDLFYSPSASNPTWTLIGTQTPVAPGESTMSAIYTLPYGSTTQAIRAQFRYGGSPEACTNGVFNDRDDLVFSVRPNDRLLPGEFLSVDQKIVSADGRWTLIMQGDGNLVLYDRAGKAYWSSKTSGHYDVDVVEMQRDGNLVIHTTGGKALWTTNTFGAGSTLVMQDDANLVIYNAEGKALWSSKTCCH